MVSLFQVSWVYSDLIRGVSYIKRVSVVSWGFICFRGFHLFQELHSFHGFMVSFVSGRGVLVPGLIPATTVVLALRQPVS